LQQNRIPILTVLAKTEILRQVNGFTENYLIPKAEDYHLWLKLLMKGYKFWGSDLILAAYREHTRSFSNGDKIAIPEVIEALEDLKQEFKNYRTLINVYQKKWFQHYHYSKSEWNKNQYKELIRKNCSYLGKGMFTTLFITLYSFWGLNLTRRLMNMLIN
jgi:hypothetical protein